MMPIRAVIITGASSGIGQACALHLDGMGFRVFAGVRKASDADALRQEASERLMPVFMEVTDIESVAAAARTVAASTGEAGLAGLVNNSGIVVSGPLAFLPVDELRRQLEVNVVGQMAVTRFFLPSLCRGQGRIVNMGSVSGRAALPFMGPYAASKFALRALNDTLRMELRRWGVRVALVEPGAVRTPLWGKSIALADGIMQQMPEQAHAVYGRALQRVRAHAEGLMQAGAPAEVVVKAVVHALTARRPRAYYRLYGGRLAQLLPTRLRDWLIANAIGL